MHHIMKTRFFSLMFLLVISLTSMAQDGNRTPITWSVGYFDPSGTINQRPKSPVYPPTVYLENHTLTFSPTHPEYILYIKDADDTVVYTTVVSVTETTAVLPTTLSGSYEIVLVMGNRMFTGWIDLAEYAPTCKIPRKSKSV